MQLAEVEALKTEVQTILEQHSAEIAKLEELHSSDLLSQKEAWTKQNQESSCTTHEPAEQSVTRPTSTNPVSHGWLLCSSINDSYQRHVWV